MVPTFFILLAVLGLSILTWIEVNAIKGKVDGLENSIRNIKPKHASEVEKEPEKEKDKKDGDKKEGDKKKDSDKKDGDKKDPEKNP